MSKGAVSDVAVTFRGKVQVLKEGPRTEQNRFFLIAATGVRYSISTPLQFPADLPNVGLSGNANGGKKSVFNEKSGKWDWVSDGPIDIDVTIIGNAKDPVVAISPSGGAPIVFELGTAGWRYISGKGTLKMASGQTVSFPK